MLEGDGFMQRFDHSGVLHTLRLLSKTCSQKKSIRYDTSAPPLVETGTSARLAHRYCPCRARLLHCAWL